MRIAVYPGSFDPITLGHLDVLQRAAAIFDRVVVAVLTNPSKSPLFSVEERLELIKASMAESGDGFSNVELGSFDGLIVDYAAKMGATAIVKGLRAVSDFESEFQQALFNRKLNPQITTVFLMTGFSNVFLSSSLVKEVARYGGDVSFALTPTVARRMAALAEEAGG